MRCVKCGQKLISGQSSCPICGAKISLESSPKKILNSDSFENTNQQKSFVSNNSLKRLAVGGLVLTFTFLLVLSSENNSD